MNVSKMEFFNNNNFYTAGLFIVFFFLLDILVTSVFVLAGISLYYPLFIALAVSIGVLGWCRYAFLRLPVSFPVVLIISLVAIVLSFMLSGIFYDFSWDGRIHFQESVIQLAQGWNSFTTGFKYGDYWWGYRWIEAYPLGIQFYCASVCEVFGMLYAKSYNFLMLGAGFLTIFPCLRRFFPSLAALCVTVSLLLYPCVLSQLWTMYIDGFIYLMFIIGMACLYHFAVLENKSLKYASVVIISAIIIFYPAFKISCVLFSGFLFLAYIWLCRKQWRFLIPFVAILPLILLIGWQPYFNHNIFDTIDTVLFVADGSLGASLKDVPGPVVYFKNMFYTHTNLGGNQVVSGLLLKRLLYDYSWGLYGYWWILMFFIALAYALVYIRKYRGFIILILAVIILPMAVKSLVNQRYYPLTYLFPFLVFMPLYKDRVLPKLLPYLLLILVLGNIAYQLSGMHFVLNTNIMATRFINSRVALLKNDPRDFVYVNFTSTGHPILLELAYSDRLWLENTGKTFYVPLHVENLRSIEERFNAGKVLDSVEGIVASKLNITLKNEDKKPLAIKIDFEAMRALEENASNIYLYLDDGHKIDYKQEYSSTFTSTFLQRINTGSGYYVYFELPFYAEKIELSSNNEAVVFTGFEIREVEIELPKY